VVGPAVGFGVNDGINVGAIVVGASDVSVAAEESDRADCEVADVSDAVLADVVTKNPVELDVDAGLGLF